MSEAVTAWKPLTERLLELIGESRGTDNWPFQQLSPSWHEQARAMWAGTRRLLMLEVPTPIPVLSRRLTPATKLGLTRYPYQNVPDLLDDCVTCAVDTIVERAGGPAWDADGYAKLRDAVRAELPDTTAEIVRITERVVAAAHEVRE